MLPSIEIFSLKTFENEINSAFEIFIQEKTNTFKRQNSFIFDTFRSNQTENNVLRT